MAVWTHIRWTRKGAEGGSRQRPFLSSALAVGLASATALTGALVVGGAGPLSVDDSTNTDAVGASALASADDAVLVSRSTCSDVLVIGIDGNGQGRNAKQGQTVNRVITRLSARGRAEGRSVTTQRVRMSTPGAATILATKRGTTLKAVSKAGLKRWRKPIAAGAKSTRRLVRQQLRACPERQVVLVGYAQGAAVAHRVAQTLAKTDKLANVAAVVAISDPDRVSGSKAGRPLGKPGATVGTQGILPRFGKSAGDLPAPAGTFGVVPVCHRGDLVCNPNKSAARQALRTALSYGGKSSATVMRRAADRAWAQVSLWPVSSAQQVVVPAGKAFSQQLTVRGGSPSGAAAQWSAIQVPDGLSLGADGVLSGTLPAPGIYEVKFTVAGTNPVTTPKSATLLVRSDAASGARSAGGMSTCSVATDGTAMCWGRNDFGQLGDGTNTLRVSPTAVQGEGWSRIAVGGSFTCGVKTDGTLWCWGLNNFGQLGGADRASSNVPRQVGTEAVWRQVTASWTHACATKSDGTMWCWGQNHHGQLGNGQNAPRSQAPVAVAGKRQWVQVSAGEWHTCGVTAQGEGFCWGNNGFGQLGDGGTAVRKRPRLVTGGHRFSQLSATWNRTCGLTTGGAALCWGENSFGQLGNGTRTDSLTPVAVSGNTTYAQIATTLMTTCATRTDGQVLCWGDNRYGQMGPGSSGTSTTPTAAGVASTGAIVTGGWLHFCGADSCWGANDAGQQGNGATAAPGMPTEPPPPWGPITRLTHQQVKNWGAKRIARKALAARPAVSARAVQGKRKRNSFAFEVMSFNVLGSQHTAPSGTRPAFAPGRVRTEWSRDLIERRGATLIGLSEPQPDQITSFDVSTNGAYSYYPGNTQGYDAAPQSVMWKDSDWEFVWGNTAQMPFMRKSRPQPVVRLRHKASGRDVYMINAHLSPGKMQEDRDKGMAIIVQLVKELEGDKLPIIVTGDLNEHGKAFRRIACKTSLKAAVGGNASAGNCVLPSHMRVDWIFGGGGSFSNTAVDVSNRVKRTTDHAVVSSRFTVE